MCRKAPKRLSQKAYVGHTNSPQIITAIGTRITVTKQSGCKAQCHVIASLIVTIPVISMAAATAGCIIKWEAVGVSHNEYRGDVRVDVCVENYPEGLVHTLNVHKKAGARTVPCHASAGRPGEVGHCAT